MQESIEQQDDKAGIPISGTTALLQLEIQTGARLKALQLLYVPSALLDPTPGTRNSANVRLVDNNRQLRVGLRLFRSTGASRPQPALQVIHGTRSFDGAIKRLRPLGFAEGECRFNVAMWRISHGAMLPVCAVGSAFRTMSPGDYVSHSPIPPKRRRVYRVGSCRCCLAVLNRRRTCCTLN